MRLKGGVWLVVRSCGDGVGVWLLDGNTVTCEDVCEDELGGHCAFDNHLGIVGMAKHSQHIASCSSRTN